MRAFYQISAARVNDHFPPARTLLGQRTSRPLVATDKMSVVPVLAVAPVPTYRMNSVVPRTSATPNVVVPSELSVRVTVAE